MHVLIPLLVKAGVGRGGGERRRATESRAVLLFRQSGTFIGRPVGGKERRERVGGGKEEEGRGREGRGRGREGRGREEGGKEGGRKEGRRRKGGRRREERKKKYTSPTTCMAGEVTDTLTLRGRTLTVPLDPLFHH